MFLPCRIIALWKLRVKAVIENKGESEGCLALLMSNIHRFFRDVKQKQKALCNAIPPSIKRFEEHTYGQMVFKAKSANAQRDIHGASLDLLQKREIG